LLHITLSKERHQTATRPVNTLIAAELLPEIEAVMVRKVNEQMVDLSPAF